MTTAKMMQQLTEHDASLIEQIDHINYVVHFDNQDAFLETWKRLGFREMMNVTTQTHNCNHIAMISGKGGVLPWGAMTVLTISRDAESAVNRFLEQFGPGVHYFAYAVSPVVEMDDLLDTMKAWGWNMMTPVLEYKSSSGPLMKVLAVAPSVPFGPFVCFIQRFPDRNGKTFEGFDTMLLDQLFDHYVDFSEELQEVLSDEDDDDDEEE